MNKLVKVSAHDCVICAQLSYHDVSIAEDAQMEFEVVELEDLAKAEGTDVYNYVTATISKVTGPLWFPSISLWMTKKCRPLAL